MTKPCSLPVVGSDVPLWEALKEALLPLSHEIVGTDPSHGDNEDACCRLRGGGWERKREKRKREMSRAVENLRISCLGGGFGASICSYSADPLWWGYDPALPRNPAIPFPVRVPTCAQRV